jgi:hypothetical protein
VTRKVAWLAAVVTLVASGSYIFVYLYRWEWHRALIVAVLFIAAEVATAAALVYRRVGSLQRRLEQRWEGDDEGRVAPDGAVVDILRTSAPDREHFAWLDPRNGRTGVFIPVLLGSGAIVSALAWLVERIAGRAAEPTVVRRLGRELSAIAFPRGGLVADERELLAQEGRSRHDEDLALLLGPGAAP